MEFKIFAKKLKNVIGGKSNTKIFTKTILFLYVKLYKMRWMHVRFNYGEIYLEKDIEVGNNQTIENKQEVERLKIARDKKIRRANEDEIASVLELST